MPAADGEPWQTGDGPHDVWIRSVGRCLSPVADRSILRPGGRIQAIDLADNPAAAQFGHLDDLVGQSLASLPRLMVKSRPTQDPARGDLCQREILDCAVVSLRYIPPKVEHSCPTPQWFALVEGWRRPVLDVSGNQCKEHLQIAAVEGLLGAVEGVLEQAAPNGARQAVDQICRQRGQRRCADLHSVDEATVTRRQCSTCRGPGRRRRPPAWCLLRRSVRAPRVRRQTPGPLAARHGPHPTCAVRSHRHLA
jgi:hypothetical protein